jgi:23S rRNA (cytosine1962-C5)-methyltransferase
MMNKIFLKPGREKVLLRRHPWVFSGAVARLEGTFVAGETVAVHSSRDDFLAWAAYSPHSQIRARVWAWDETQVVSPGFLRDRLLASILRREDFLEMEDDGAYRLVHAESDGMPGLIVDRYAGVLVVQFLSAGVEFWRVEITAILEELFPGYAIYERSDAEARKLEGLEQRSGLLAGELPDPLVIREGGLRWLVDVRAGHKTGFYLDQRDNRRRVSALAPGKRVLDCFSYTGGFSLATLAAGAKSVRAIDSSAPAHAMARRNLDLNSLPGERIEFWEADVFNGLRELRDRARQYDLIVLDPPKFAPTAAQAKRAARGYKDINLLALKLLAPGGLLATFSCSGGVDLDLFQKIVAGAALDAGVEARILEVFHQAPDHPVALNFPEGAYLKGLLIGV